MQVDRRLRLIVPIYADDETTITGYVHSSPISRETFDAHYLLLSKTFAAIYAQGLGEIVGPRVASNVLRDVAKQLRDEAGAVTLINEIHRLTNMLVPGRHGWDMIPFQDVVDKQSIHADDVAEVSNAIIFFIAVSAIAQRQTRRDMLDGAARLWGAQISPLDYAAFAASLPTSTATANTGVTPTPASSVPY